MTCIHSRLSFIATLLPPRNQHQFAVLHMDAPIDIRGSKRGQLRVSKSLFIGGFFLLPWLWFINFCFFAPFLRNPDTPTTVKICMPSGRIMHCYYQPTNQSISQSVNQPVSQSGNHAYWLVGVAVDCWRNRYVAVVGRVCVGGRSGRSVVLHVCQSLARLGPVGREHAGVHAQLIDTTCPKHP
jgi:hypothetical protein